MYTIERTKFVSLLLLFFLLISFVTSCTPVEPVETQLELETKKVIASGIPITDFELTAIELPFFKGYTEEMKRISALDDKIRSFNRVIDYIYLVDEERLLFIYEDNTKIRATLFHWQTGEWQSLDFSQPIQVGGLYRVAQINNTTYGFSVGNPDKQNELYLLQVEDTLSESGPYILPGIGAFAAQQFSLSPKLHLACLVDSNGTSFSLYNWNMNLANELTSYPLRELGLSEDVQIQQVHFLNDDTLFFSWKSWKDTKSVGYGVVDLRTRKTDVQQSLSDEVFYWFDLGYVVQDDLENTMIITDTETKEIQIEKSAKACGLSRRGVLEPLQGNLGLFPMDPKLSESIKEGIPETFNMLLHSFKPEDDLTVLLMVPRESISYSYSQTRSRDRDSFTGVQDLLNRRIFSVGAEKMFEEKMMLYVIKVE